MVPEANHVLKAVPADDRAANLAAYSDPSLPLADGCHRCDRGLHRRADGRVASPRAARGLGGGLCRGPLARATGHPLSPLGARRRRGSGRRSCASPWISASAVIAWPIETSSEGRNAGGEVGEVVDGQVVPGVDVQPARDGRVRRRAEPLDLRRPSRRIVVQCAVRARVELDAVAAGRRGAVDGGGVGVDEQRHPGATALEAGDDRRRASRRARRSPSRGQRSPAPGRRALASPARGGWPRRARGSARSGSPRR